MWFSGCRNFRSRQMRAFTSRQRLPGRPTVIPQSCGYGHATALPAIASNPSGSSSYMTKREQDVLQLLLQGETNKAIAVQLKISEYTVRDHVSSLLRQLNVNTRSQLIAKLAVATPLPPTSVGFSQLSNSFSIVRPLALVCPAPGFDSTSFRACHSKNCRRHDQNTMN